MPHYTFRNKETDEEFDVEMSISERDQYVTDHPEFEQILGSSSLAIGDPLKLGVSKNPRLIEFQKYVLPNIAAQNPLGRIGKDTKFQLKRDF